MRKSLFLVKNHPTLLPAFPGKSIGHRTDQFSVLGTAIFCRPSEGPWFVVVRNPYSGVNAVGNILIQKCNICVVFPSHFLVNKVLHPGTYSFPIGIYSTFIFQVRLSNHTKITVDTPGPIEYIGVLGMFIFAVALELWAHHVSTRITFGQKMVNWLIIKLTWCVDPLDMF